MSAVGDHAMTNMHTDLLQTLQNQYSLHYTVIKEEIWFYEHYETVRKQANIKVALMKEFKVAVAPLGLSVIF